MSTNLTPPTLVMNSAGQRQQVPLRDYLNARIAPFLKKAMTESLASEAEFPLQWLGECLIHQSMLFEGNPDTTNIRERFRYNFDVPAAPQEEPPTTAPVPTNGVEATVEDPSDPTAAAAAAVPVPAPDSSMVNGETREDTEVKAEASTDVQDAADPTAPQDVDMAGTT